MESSCRSVPPRHLCCCHIVLEEALFQRKLSWAQAPERSLLLGRDVCENPHGIAWGSLVSGRSCRALGNGLCLPAEHYCGVCTGGAGKCGREQFQLQGGPRGRQGAELGSGSAGSDLSLLLTCKDSKHALPAAELSVQTEVSTFLAAKRKQESEKVQNWSVFYCFFLSPRYVFFPTGEFIHPPLINSLLPA